MKSLIFLSAISLISFISGYSQDLKFGILAGMDLANIRIINLPDVHGIQIEPIVTFNINGYIGYKSVGFWGISAEPGFIQKGSLFKEDDSETGYRNNYIQIPVLLDIRIFKKLFLSIGPELGWLIHSEVGSTACPNCLIALYDKKFELSGLAGISYNIIKYIDIGIRYNHGLTNIFKTSWTDALGNKNVTKEYNQYFQFLLRFKI
jgi:hypothetical protein